MLHDVKRKEVNPRNYTEVEFEGQKRENVGGDVHTEVEETQILKCIFPTQQNLSIFQSNVLRNILLLMI